MYDKLPFVPAGTTEQCISGWQAIASAIAEQANAHICVECYPGVLLHEIEEAFKTYLPDWRIVRTDAAFLPADVIASRFADLLSDDPVFGRMSETEIQDFFDPKS